MINLATHYAHYTCTQIKLKGQWSFWSSTTLHLYTQRSMIDSANYYATPVHKSKVTDQSGHSLHYTCTQIKGNWSIWPFTTLHLYTHQWSMINLAIYYTTPVHTSMVKWSICPFRRVHLAVDRSLWPGYMTLQRPVCLDIHNHYGPTPFFTYTHTHKWPTRSTLHHLGWRLV